MLYPIYATPPDLAQYLSVKIEELPEDVERLLDRASELIYYAIMGRPIKEMEVNLKKSVSMATCAQVEYWMNIGEEGAISGMVNPHSFSIGDISMNFGGGGSGTSSNQDLPSGKYVSPRSRMYLNMEGLMYRGVRI